MLQHHLGFFLRWIIALGLLGRTGLQLLGFDDHVLLDELSNDRCLAALAAFKQRSLYANIVNDPRVDYHSSAIRLAPLASSPTSSTSEIVAVAVEPSMAINDAAPHHGMSAICSRSLSRSPDVVHVHSSAALTRKQVALVKRLRRLSFRTVDLRFDRWLSRYLAHSCQKRHNCSSSVGRFLMNFQTLQQSTVAFRDCPRQMGEPFFSFSSFLTDH